LANYLELAAKLGKLEIVKSLTRIQLPDRDNAALKLATMNGHYEVVKYLLDNRMYSNDDLLLIALKNNDEILINYLLNYDVGREAMNWVIFWDLLDMFVKIYDSYSETDY